MNKIRFDRFSAAVDKCFDDSNKGGQVRWTELKEDIFIGMSDWYRRTHAGTEFLCFYFSLYTCMYVYVFTTWYESWNSYKFCFYHTVVSPESSALDMSGIMEAYWHLSAKRFVDSSCMMTDR